jgi:hypothetical protein
MRHWRWYSKVLLGLVLAAFAYWVWPTPWGYDHTRLSDEECVIRLNRVTGRPHLLLLVTKGEPWYTWVAFNQGPPEPASRQR